MNKVGVYIVVITLLLVSSIYFIPTSEGVETEYTIWLSTDAQIRQSGGVWSKNYWIAAVQDANDNFNVDVAFHIGDELMGYTAGTPTGDYAEIISSWADFHTSFNNINVNYYKNYTIGNHETSPLFITEVFDGKTYRTGNCWQWDNISGRLDDDVIPYGNYTYQFGNILFIVLGTEAEQSGPPAAMMYRRQLEWFNTTVQANSDKNIVVLNHIPLYPTVAWHATPPPYAGMNVSENAYFRNVIENESDNVVAYFCGHWHYTQAHSGMVVNKSWGNGAHGFTIFSNAGSINNDGGSSDSQFLYVKEGNQTATIRARDHDSETWIDINGASAPASTYYPFSLKYSFTMDEEVEEIEFISIDDGTNGTTINSINPTFNYTLIADTSEDWLQFANDSAFTDLVVNITDINEYNYPSEYDANETRVSFTLPVANSLQVIDKTYYCRVQTNTK